MGQGEENNIMACQNLGCGVLNHSIGKGNQMRLELAQSRTSIGVSSQRPNLHIRVPGKDSKELPSCVPCASGDSYCETHGNKYATCGIDMHILFSV